MTKLPQSNIYSASADDVRSLFADYLDGSEACVALGVSSSALGEAARTAVEKSVAALGYGEEACAFATLGPHGMPAGSECVRLDSQAMFMLVEGLDPVLVICTDAKAAEALGAAYRTGFPLDSAIRVFGRPGAAFRDLEALMTSDAGKQHAWKVLKSLPKR